MSAILTAVCVVLLARMYYRELMKEPEIGRALADFIETLEIEQEIASSRTDDPEPRP